MSHSREETSARFPVALLAACAVTFAPTLVFAAVPPAARGARPREPPGRGLVDAGTGTPLWEQPKSATILSGPIQTPTMVLMNHMAMQGKITGLGRIG